MKKRATRRAFVIGLVLMVVGAFTLLPAIADTGPPTESATAIHSASAGTEVGAPSIHGTKLFWDSTGSLVSAFTNEVIHLTHMLPPADDVGWGALGLGLLAVAMAVFLKAYRRRTMGVRPSTTSSDYFNCDNYGDVDSRNGKRGPAVTGHSIVRSAVNRLESLRPVPAFAGAAA